MGSLTERNCTTAFRHEDRSRLVPGPAFACTAESRTHGKINSLLKMMEKQNIIDVTLNGPDDCNDGDNGEAYYCPNTDKCCGYPVNSGDDDDWVCCPVGCLQYGIRCAAVDWACGAC